MSLGIKNHLDVDDWSRRYVKMRANTASLCVGGCQNIAVYASRRLAKSVPFPHPG